MPELKLTIAGIHYATGALAHLGRTKTPQPVRFVRDWENKHDRHAVAVYDGEQKLGYIPRGASQLVAALMTECLPLKGSLIGPIPMAGKICIEWQLQAPAERKRSLRELLTAVGVPLTPNAERR